MDVVAYQAAMKAKRAIQKERDRLGIDGTEQDQDIRDDYGSVKARLEKMEENDPGVAANDRVSKLAESTAVNINKYNLKVNSVLNQDQYKLSDHVFDDFGDDSGIDSDLSSGYSYDASGRKVVIDEGEERAEVVTVAEETNTPPIKVSVVQATNEKNEAESPFDLENGEHINTVVRDGKIELLKVKSLDQTYMNIVPIMSSYSSEEGDVIYSSESSRRQAWWVFDANPQTKWVNNTTDGKGWIGYAFKEGKVIEKIAITSAYDAGYGDKQAPKVFTVEGSFTGSASDWIEINTFSDVVDWSLSERREFELTNSTGYTHYRINILENNGQSYAGIDSLELMEAKEKPSYASKGTYESPVLDLGDNFEEIINLDVVEVGAMESTVALSTSTSEDGINFTDYEEINEDGTLQSPSARYIKLKAELTAGSEEKVTVAHDFLEEENSDFEDNEFIVFDGAAKLKTEYVDEMEVDSSFTGEGTLLKAVIDKSKFKKFERVEVK